MQIPKLKSRSNVAPVIVNLFVIFIVLFVFRLIRLLGLSSEDFFSPDAWLQAVGGTEGFAVLLVTVTLSTIATFTLRRISYDVQDLGKITGDLSVTSNELALQARYSIRDFDMCKQFAENMLFKVKDNKISVVKIAVFWPMFGADKGHQYNNFINGKSETIDFDDKSENLFYHYLFSRIEYNFPTKVLFLSYNSKDSDKTPLRTFFDALRDRDIANNSGKVWNNIPITRLDELDKVVVDHIKKKILPKAIIFENVDVRLTTDLPLLLFIAEQKSEDSGPNYGRVIHKSGLLFLSNTNMISKGFRLGGFYTRDKDMVQILEKLFDSLHEPAITIQSSESS